MTTLGSWIDDEVLAQVIKDLCPREDAVAWKNGNRQYAPKVGLEPGDLHRPELYGESKFPNYSGEEASVPLESIRVSEDAEKEAAGAGGATREGMGMVQRLVSLKQRAERSGLIGPVAGAGTASPGIPLGATSLPMQAEFRSRGGPLAERLADFVSWVKQQTHARHVCLADARGEPLTDDSVPAGLSIASSLLADAILRARDSFPLSSVIHCSLGRSDVLSTVAVRKADQVFSISVVAGAPLSGAFSSALARGFLSTLQ